MPNGPSPEESDALPHSTSGIPCISSASFWAPVHLVESAWLEHGPFAFWLTEALQPRSFVELGTHNGFSYLTFCQAVQRLGLPTSCHAIDTWQGDEHAGFYGEDVFATLSTTNARNYLGFSRLIRSRFDEALPYFSDESIDLLHIDGRHTYDDVRQDFESWKPKLSKRGIVLLHDTVVREREFGVWRLWEELSAQYPSFEFIHGNGLGIIAVGEDIPAPLQHLFQANPAEKAAICSAYARLGGAVSHLYQVERAGQQLAVQGAEIHRLTAEFKAQADALAAMNAQAQAQASALSQAEEQLQHLMEAQEQAQAEVQARLQEKDQALTEAQTQAQTQAQALSQALEDARKRAARTESQALSAVSRRMREAERARDALQERLDQALAEAAEQANLIGLLTKTVEDLTREGGLTRQQLTLLQQSTMWRATAPFRSSLSRLPTPLRKIMRQSARAAWWAVTPHRMPERIAFLRAQKSGGVVANAIAALPAVLSEINPLSNSPREFAFTPAEKGSGKDRTADHNGRYSLKASPAGYTYVPPQRPHDLDRQLDAMPNRPQFSIVVPVYNTTEDLLLRLLASVQAQWYPDWQLVLADDASPSEETKRLLRDIDDPRIEVMFLEKNSGISGATNAGLTRATGDYIIFADHDDELTEDCLYELALCIQREDPDFIYSDEDKIAEDGSFAQPFFKPDWSPDTLMSTMYTGHISCVRREVLEAAGPLRSEFDGAQDWDLVLRITEKSQRIAHIPKVLYHWRVIPASIAADLAAKPYAVEAARKARVAALERRGLDGVMEPVANFPGYYRVNYALRGNPLISIVIPSRNNGAVLQRCVESIRTLSDYRNIEIIILDNGSDQPATLEILRELSSGSDVTVIRHDAPFNYSELNNIGARKSRGDILLFLNDDTEVISPDWLQRMGGYAQREHVGAVGAKLIYPKSRKVQHCGILNLAAGPGHAFLGEDAGSPGYFMRNLLEYDWVAVTGACLMVERTKFEVIGGFDESFPIAYNDVEICFRLVEKGLFNLVCPTVELLHHESLSRGHDDQTPERRARLNAERQRLYIGHPQFMMHDPFYNPNLHPNRLHFELPA